MKNKIGISPGQKRERKEKKRKEERRRKRTKGQEMETGRRETKV